MRCTVEHINVGLMSAAPLSEHKDYLSSVIGIHAAHSVLISSKRIHIGEEKTLSSFHSSILQKK